MATCLVTFPVCLFFFYARFQCSLDQGNIFFSVKWKSKNDSSHQVLLKTSRVPIFYKERPNPFVRVPRPRCPGCRSPPGSLVHSPSLMLSAWILLKCLQFPAVLGLLAFLHTTFPPDVTPALSCVPLESPLFPSRLCSSLTSSDPFLGKDVYIVFCAATTVCI